MNNMPTRHLPPLGSQTVGGGEGYLTSSRAGGGQQDRGDVRTQQLYEDTVHPSGYGKIAPGSEGMGDSAVHLPAVRPGSSAGSRRSKGEPGGNEQTKPRFLAMSPETALNTYRYKMSLYEHGEIFNYPAVFFVGPMAAKRPGVVGTANNDGYDDTQGTYIQVALL